MIGTLVGALLGEKVAHKVGSRYGDGFGALVGASLASRRTRKLGLAGLALAGGLTLLQRRRRQRAERDAYWSS